MMKQTPVVACLGLMVADIVGRPIDALPKKGTLDVIERIELHTGGNGANTSSALAKIGTPVAAFGRVGDDSFGEFILSSLSKWGVVVDGITRDSDVPTAATMVMVHSDAERSFIHVAGANATLKAEHFDWDKAAGIKILHIAGLQLMTSLEGDGLLSIMQEAKQRGLVTTLDTVMNPRSRWWEALAPALPYIDWLLPSHGEAEKLTGKSQPAEQVAFFREFGSTNVIVKLGEGGCYVAPQDEEPFTAFAFPVTPIDSLGAGDSWCAGFLTGLVNDWPLHKTVYFANAVGACCVQALGANTGVKSLEDTLAWMDAELIRTLGE